MTESSMRIAVTGASGLVASHLIPALRAEGHNVVPVSRRRLPNGIQWDPVRGQLASAELEGIDTVIHLAGEGIADKRWSAARKRAILESRTRPTHLLATALAELRRPPAALISMSAMGYYGDGGDRVLTEESSAGNDFLAGVVQAWEAAAEPARTVGIRVVHPRMGIVLSPDGGALAKMLPPFRLGVGGRLGSGRQWMSWIAIGDVVAALRHCMVDERLTGPVNLTSPFPVTNAVFTEALGRVLRRPAIIPVPAVALKVLFGELAEATLLTGQRMLPGRLEEAGYPFQYPEIEPALRHLLSNSTPN